ncbi:hypothetical protein AAMO2058_000084100 [Amorphochlora amoebiformis]
MTLALSPLRERREALAYSQVRRRYAYTGVSCMCILLCGSHLDWEIAENPGFSRLRGGRKTPSNADSLARKRRRIQGGETVLGGLGRENSLVGDSGTPVGAGSFSANRTSEMGLRGMVAGVQRIKGLLETIEETVRTVRSRCQKLGRFQVGMSRKFETCAQHFGNRKQRREYERKGLGTLPELLDESFDLHHKAKAVISEMQQSYNDLTEAHKRIHKETMTIILGDLPPETQPSEPKSHEPSEHMLSEPKSPKTLSEPSESKPTESKPTESKPTESKRTEAEPSAPKPTEPKPMEFKPSELKPSEPKPSESKPSESKISEPPNPANFKERDGGKLVGHNTTEHKAEELCPYQIAGYLRGGLTGKWYDLRECVRNEDGTYRVKYADDKFTRALRLNGKVLPSVRPWKIRLRPKNNTYKIAKKSGKFAVENRQIPQNLTNPNNAVSTSSIGMQNTVYIEGLPFEVTEDDIKDLFGECGEIAEVRLPRRQNGKKKGYGFVEFSTGSAAQTALELDQVELKGRYLKVSLSENTNHKKAYERRKITRPKFCKTIFVGNIGWTATSEEIKAEFEKCGTVVDVRLGNRKGRSLGYAHVDFTDESGVDMAIETMQGINIGGRPIRIDYAASSQAGRPSKSNYRAAS